MRSKYAPRPMVEIARRAVAIGPLKKIPARHGLPLWSFGHRTFGDATVQKLIESGAAVRVGDEVRAA